MAEAGIGSPISKEVIAQIEARRSVIGKQERKTNDDLRFLSGNTAWIKLSSGVNTLSKEEIKTLKQNKERDTITGANTLAADNILLGGILSNNKQQKGGIEQPGRSNPSAAYRNSPNTTGIRPMPGITGMKVASKNTFGTLREATVTISVWTLEDFETIEKLYLRPGFTMLLEWGHSLYLNNQGVLQKTIKTVSPENFFFSRTSFSKITAEISQIRKESKYNYEGMVGYVKNFSWNYLSTGEYECTVTIISAGEILESLQPRIHPASREGITSTDIADMGASQDAVTPAEKSPLHFFRETLKWFTIEPYQFTRNSAFNPSYFYPNFYKRLTSALIVGQKIDTEHTWYWFDKTKQEYWLPLSFYLELFTKFFSIVDETQKAESVDRYTPKFYSKVSQSTELEKKKTSKYTTFEGHFSVDPSVCVLPKKPGGVFQDVTLPTNIEKAIKAVDYASKGGADNVLNILVNLSYVLSIVDNALNEKFEITKSILDIVKEMFTGINTSLAITDIGLTFDEEFEGGTYFVVDRNNTPKESVKSPELKLAGIDSIFTEVGISSTITSKIASQIGIASQGSTGNFTENVENILRWNPGVVDRVHTVKSTSENKAAGSKATADEEKLREEKWLADVITFMEAYNGTGYTPEQQQATRTLHQEQMVKYMINNAKKEQRPIPGLIPVELSFKMDGLGGLKIAETFTISGGILPRKYQDKFGYIITGLEHSVDSNNRWMTDVKSQFYLIEKASSDEAFKEEVIVSDKTPSKKRSDNTPQSYGTQSCATDAMIIISPNYNLANLSCASILPQGSIPAPGNTKTHPTYGALSREDIIKNLTALAINVLEPIKKAYPTMFVTNAYRNDGNKSQHEAGMAVDLQFTDIAGSIADQNAQIVPRAQAIKELLGTRFDQFLLEFKTTGSYRPWIHISYREGKNRNDLRTFLNDKTALNGEGNLYNPLAK